MCRERETIEKIAGTRNHEREEKRNRIIEVLATC